MRTVSADVSLSRVVGIEGAGLAGSVGVDIGGQTCSAEELGLAGSTPRGTLRTCVICAGVVEVPLNAGEA